MAITMTVCCCLQTIETKAYSSSKAISYAKKYWKNANADSYPVYSSDCTNYVSQCVHAGEIAKKDLPASVVKFSDFSNTYMTKKYWSCNYYKYKVGKVTIRKGYIPTSTWTIVDQSADASSYGFQDYMDKKKSKKTIAYSCSSEENLKMFISKCSKGDVVQIKYKGKNRYSHSYIIGNKKKNTSYKNKMDIYFYSHTTARDASSDDSLWCLYAKGKIPKDATLMVIKM